MKTELTTPPPPQLACDLLALPISTATLRAANVQELDAALGGLLLGEAQTNGFRGDEGTHFLYQTHGVLPSRNLLLIGCRPSPSPGVLYSLAARAHATGEAVGTQRISIALGDWASAEAIGTVAEGMMLARYRFEPYRSRPPSRKTVTVVFSTATVTPEHKRALARAARTRSSEACSCANSSERSHGRTLISRALPSPPDTLATQKGRPGLPCAPFSARFLNSDFPPRPQHRSDRPRHPARWMSP